MPSQTAPHETAARSCLCSPVRLIPPVKISAQDSGAKSDRSGSEKPPCQTPLPTPGQFFSTALPLVSKRFRSEKRVPPSDSTSERTQGHEAQAQTSTPHATHRQEQHRRLLQMAQASLGSRVRAARRGTPDTPHPRRETGPHRQVEGTAAPLAKAPTLGPAGWLSDHPLPLPAIFPAEAPHSFPIVSVRNDAPRERPHRRDRRTPRHPGIKPRAV